MPFMAEVEFEDRKSEESQEYYSEESPGLVSYLVDKGVVQNEKQAIYILVGGLVFLIIIAVFVYMAASNEETQTNIRYTLKKFRVGDVLAPRVVTVAPDASLSQVLAKVFHYHQEDFPVVEGKKLVGFLTRQDIMASLHQFGPEKQVSEVMRSDIPSIGVDEHLIEVHKKMERSGVKALPVVRNLQLLGIVTLEDISRVYSVMHNNSNQIPKE